MDTGRVGPFEVVAEISKAPGALLVEARDADGERRLLQLARFRAPTDDDEKDRRQDEERAVAKRTAELIADPEITVHAHGGADDASGERVIFWALPFEDPARSLAGQTLSADALLELGVRLARRLVDRHQVGKLDPLLSEHLIRRTDGGDVFVIGVPVAVDRSWVADTMPPYRFAPEENGSPLESGDLYRLGKLLENLAPEELPVPLAEAISRLQSAPDRFDSAKEALETLESLGDVPPDDCAKETEQTAPVDPLASFSTPEVSQPEISVPAFQAEAVAEASADAVVGAAFDQPQTTDPAVLTERAPTEPEVEVPTTAPDAEPIVDAPDEEAPAVDAPSDDVASIETASADETEPDEPVPTDLDVEPLPPDFTPDLEAVASEAVTTQAEPETPIPAPEPSVIPVEAGEVDDPAEEAPSDPPHESAVIARHTVDTDGGVDALDVIAASWRQPVLPSGESPWSEVVEARGAHHRTKETFEGFEGELPSAVPETKPPQERPVTPSRSPLEPDVAAAISGFDAKKVVTAVLALLVIFGLFALLARSQSDDVRAEDLLEVPPTNELVLESDPAGATVVAVLDGAVLGKTPLSFLVARKSSPVVFVTEVGYEPLRMTLPERGTIHAKLTPLSAEPCELDLRVLGGAKLEGVGFELGADHHIPGAGIVRAVDGPTVGARLLSCPSLGGAERQVVELTERRSTARVRITSPAGAQAFLDGDPLGRVPAETDVRKSFARVRVEGADGMSESRLVPTAQDVEVRMPVPKPRRMPVIDQPAPEAPIAELTPSGDYEAAVRAFDRGKLRQAKARFEECLGKDEADALCHRGLADLHRRMRSPQKARQHYLRYLELAPDAPDADWVRDILNE